MEQFSTHGNSNLPSPSSDQKSTKRKWEDDDIQYESDPSELRFLGDAGSSKQAAWLVKLPPYLTNHWKELLDSDDNEELLLGAIRIKVPKSHENKQEMRLRLNPSLKTSRSIPQDYQLESRGSPRNMYCWAEEEGGVPKKREGPPMPIAFIERSRRGHWGSEGTREPKETTFRRPSKVNKTSFVAKFGDELLATPIRVEGAPILHAHPEVAKKELGCITPVNAQMNILRPGTVGEFPNRKGKELLFTAAAKPISGRGPKDKAYRMNKDVLISSLYKLFEEKEYWYLKEFREKLFQPEGYLRQVLKEIAIYHQDGSMAGTWELNSDSREALKWVKAQVK
ncbi:unnamed protein product [Tuber aestivum]|uniref:Transcription initiation factor IIF subunit beta n=1 Tax=Tuber aestivum TaxID=59557 RepID=A0A292PY85_9PEZI|nr:unnamed protein product [Tuber aestivum]